MKIKLEYPYDTYKHGYIVVNSENRKNVILYNSKDDRTTVSYARYLMSVKLKRRLTDNEEVDHINNDKTDDSIENLQILSREENLKKENLRRNIKTKIEVNCTFCKNSFIMEARNYRYKIKINKTNFFCSKTCVHNFLRKK